MDYLSEKNIGQCVKDLRKEGGRNTINLLRKVKHLNYLTKEELISCIKESVVDEINDKITQFSIEINLLFKMTFESTSYINKKDAGNLLQLADIRLLKYIKEDSNNIQKYKVGDANDFISTLSIIELYNKKINESDVFIKKNELEFNVDLAVEREIYKTSILELKETLEKIKIESVKKGNSPIDNKSKEDLNNNISVIVVLVIVLGILYYIFSN